jgi:hypothetical protein
LICCREINGGVSCGFAGYGSDGLKVFTGNANIPLANEISNQLGVNLGKATVMHAKCHPNRKSNEESSGMI